MLYTSREDCEGVQTPRGASHSSPGTFIASIFHPQHLGFYLLTTLNSEEQFTPNLKKASVLIPKFQEGKREGQSCNHFNSLP